MLHPCWRFPNLNLGPRLLHLITYLTSPIGLSNRQRLKFNLSKTELLITALACFSHASNDNSIRFFCHFQAAACCWGSVPGEYGWEVGGSLLPLSPHSRNEALPWTQVLRTLRPWPPCPGSWGSGSPLGEASQGDPRLLQQTLSKQSRGVWEKTVIVPSSRV